MIRRSPHPSRSSPSARRQRPRAGLAIVALVAALAIFGAACSEDAVTTDASVSIATPADGATITGPVTVQMQADGFEVEAAGPAREGAGHLHLMIDTPCVEPGSAVPFDDAHVHFGDGSTMAVLELAPGEHTLCLQAGNGIHTALDLTDTVTFTVVE